MKKGFRKTTKLARMNTRFQRGAVEITLDLFKGLSRLIKAVNLIHQDELWKLH